MKKSVFILLIVLLGLSGIASAKEEPYVEFEDWGGMDAPYVIENAEQFTGVFATLGRYGDVDAIQIKIHEAIDDWELNIGVPACGDHFVAFYPMIAVIGEGLPTAKADTLPFDVPVGMGVQVFDPMDKEAIRRISDGFYEAGFLSVDFPAANDYTLAIWEPNGHRGAYVLRFGLVHPEFTPNPIRDQERNKIWQAINSGSWVGQDCDAPVAAADCPPTASRDAGAMPESAAERWQVGSGYALNGVVLDADTCLPIPEALVRFEMTNTEGEYDGSQVGQIHTNQQGAFRIESVRPGSYENTPPHIHLIAQADGYELVNPDYVVAADETEGAIQIVLRRE